MYTRWKPGASPSIPKFKRQIEVSDFTEESYDEVEQLRNTMACSKNEDSQEVENFTDEDSEDIEYTTIEICEDVETFSSTMPDFTEESYDEVEQLRNTRFSLFDTDQLVVPSTKFLFDENLGENLKSVQPVASSTLKFPEISREEISHCESLSPVKEKTIVLPEPPYFEDEKDELSEFQLGLPKACSTLLEQQEKDNTCDIELDTPKECATLLPTKGKGDDYTVQQFTPKPRSAISRLKRRELVFDFNEISASLSHLSKSEISEEIGSKTIIKKSSEQKPAVHQQIVKDQRIVKVKNPKKSDAKRLKNRNILPTNDFDINQKDAICCLSNPAIPSSRSLKLMKPSYRTDVPIDDLWK